jgi:hypothetical protein
LFSNLRKGLQSGPGEGCASPWQRRIQGEKVNNRERTLAILNYEDYDRLPIVHFGYWRETLHKWAAEGHLTAAEAEDWKDGNPTDAAIAKKLGFDFDWSNCFGPITRLLPEIEERILEELGDGARKVLNEDGAIVIEKDGASGIPTEVDHLLKGRKEWEELFLPRLQFSEERITGVRVNTGEEELPFDGGGLDYLRRGEWENPAACTA